MSDEFAFGINRRRRHFFFRAPNLKNITPSAAFNSDEISARPLACRQTAPSKAQIFILAFDAAHYLNLTPNNSFHRAKTEIIVFRQSRSCRRFSPESPTSERSRPCISLSSVACSYGSRENTFCCRRGNR